MIPHLHTAPNAHHKKSKIIGNFNKPYRPTFPYVFKRNTHPILIVLKNNAILSRGFLVEVA